MSIVQAARPNEQFYTHKRSFRLIQSQFIWRYLRSIHAGILAKLHMKINERGYCPTIVGLLGLLGTLFYTPAVLAEKQKAETLIDRPIQAELDSNRVEKRRSQYFNDGNIDIPQLPGEEDWPPPVDDNRIYYLLLLDQLEYRANDGEDTFNWDAISWVGGDYQRLWIKTEGDVGLDTGDGEAELQLLYGKLISPFFDFQAGIKYDQVYSSDGGPGRASGVIGIQGLAPYLFELDTALFVSQDGDVSLRFGAEYQLLLTQRLILQPELETNIAIQQVEEFGVGSGLNDIELGLRLRYEISRQFAPYVGVNWTRQFGDTADLAEEEGGSTDNFALVGGLRLLF